MVGVSSIPKNLNPYVSTLSANTFVSSMVYDTLLTEISTPQEYTTTGSYTFPDGTSYEETEDWNYFNFESNLVYLEGAYEKQGNSIYGYELFDPTTEQYEAQLERKNIVFGYDEAGNENGETEEEYEQRKEKAVPSTNWMRYRFKVKEGITWSDGEEFTAEDIVFTFQYALKYSGALAQVAYFLDNYYNCYVDDGDFVLELATNKLSDIKTICQSIYIIPEHIWSSISRPNYEKNLNPVGTGLYIVEEDDYIEDQSITLTLRDDLSDEILAESFYYEPIEHIMLVGISNEEIMLNSLETGDIDVCLDSITTSKAESIMNNSSFSNVLIAEGENEFVTTLALNVGTYGAFNESNLANSDLVREAISLAIDQDTLISEVLNGKGTKVGDGLVQSVYSHALTDEAGNYIYHETNIEKANQLLDEAGYPKDSRGIRDLEFTILASSSNEAVVRSISNMLADSVGITINYEMATDTYSEDIKQSNGASFDMIINTVSFTEDKLLMFDARFGVYASGGIRTWNVTGVNDSELSELMWEMDTTQDITLQLELSKLVQAKVASLHVEIPLYCANLQYPYTEQRYEGFIPDSTGNVLNSYSIKFIQRK